MLIVERLFPAGRIPVSRPHLSFMLKLWTLHLLLWNIAAAQRASAFGPCIERDLGYVPRGMAMTQLRGQAVHRIALLASDPPGIRTYVLDSRGILVEADGFPLAKRQESIAAADVDLDGWPELLTLAADGTELTVIRHDTAGVRAQPFRVQGRPRKFIVADINNDGRSDVLLFGKAMAGVATLLNDKRGGFVRGPLLFPDFSASDLVVMDVNGDGINDVMLLNWVSNQFVVLYGISRMVFSAQVTVELPDEPVCLAATPVTRERTLRAAVTLQHERRILVISGDATGDFGVSEALATPGVATEIGMQDITGDGIEDIVTCSDNGILVAAASPRSGFRERALYGVSTSSCGLLLTDLDADGLLDLVVTDRITRRCIVLGNAGWHGSVHWPATYAVGAFPRGVLLADLNADGRTDIAVANARSSTVSVLWNQGGGRLDGQMSIPLGDSPTHLSCATGGDFPRTLVATHPLSGRITILSVGDDPSRCASTGIPTRQYPLTLQVQEADGRLTVLVRSGRPKDGSVSLSLFERIPGGRFVERNLRPKAPGKLTALAVSARAEPGLYDLLYLTQDRLSKKVTLWRAEGSRSFTFRDVRPLLTFSDSLSATRALLVAPGSRAGAPSLVAVLAGPPVNAIGSCRISADTVANDSLTWIRNARPADDEVLIDDLDGDGRTDIAYFDPDQSAIMFCSGMTGGVFSAPRPVATMAGVTGFAFGSLRKPGVQDLVLAHGTNGTVSIVFDPLRQ